MRTLYTAIAAGLLSTSALAAGAGMSSIDAVEKLSDGNTVKVSGTVTNIHLTENEFTLEDSTGKIGVEGKGKLNLKKGDIVTVSGTTKTDVLQKEIAANSITKTGHDKTWSERMQSEAREMKEDAKDKTQEIKNDLSDEKANY